MAIDAKTIRAAVSANRRLPTPATCRALRQEAGLTLEQVASSIGVSRQCVANWEAGRARPTRDNLALYLEAIELIRSCLGAAP
jgi:DNA-binding transcriptional regulator YiaG